MKTPQGPRYENSLGYSSGHCTSKGEGLVAINKLLVHW